jgi:hypothetical protein
LADAHDILIRKLEGNSPFVRPKHRQDFGIKMVVKEIGLKGMYWIQLAQFRAQ